MLSLTVAGSSLQIATQLFENILVFYGSFLSHPSLGYYVYRPSICLNTRENENLSLKYFLITFIELLQEILLH